MLYSTVFHVKCTILLYSSFSFFFLPPDEISTKSIFTKRDHKKVLSPINNATKYYLNLRYTIIVDFIEYITLFNESTDNAEEIRYKKKKQN